MIEYIIHYATIALSLLVSILTVAIGQGNIASLNMVAIDRQPEADSSIRRATILSLALMETTTLLGLVISLFLIFKSAGTLYQSIAQIGMVIAIGLPALVLGYASSQPAKNSFESIARQPFSAQQIGGFLLFTQTLIQTPLVLGFLMALLIFFQLNSVTTLGQALTLIASGIAIGLGSIGPSLGAGLFTGEACKSIGLTRNMPSNMISFTIISQVVIETPVILCLLISFLLFLAAAGEVSTLQSIVYIAASMTVGLGSLGAGIGSGLTASKACSKVVLNPSESVFTSRLTLFAQSIIDTSAIYAFIIALFFILIPVQ